MESTLDQGIHIRTPEYLARLSRVRALLAEREYDAGMRNSYPTLLEYEPSRFYAVWDSSDSPDEPRTAIRFGRLNIA